MMSDGSGTLDDAYFEWLYGQVASVQNANPRTSYWHLCRKLYTTAYYGLIPNDDNREEDGRELRVEFLNQTNEIFEDPRGLWITLDCSFLEMLIALARRLFFETDETTVEWFWRLVQNLELEGYTDAIFEVSIEEAIEEALDAVIHRTYSYDGSGGLFPLVNPTRDQRDVEIWYQMSTYLIEEEYLNVKPKI